jgi:hypothetical protein
VFPQRRLQCGDAVEQVDDEGEGGVVEGEAGSQALEPGGGGEVRQGEPQLAAGARGSVEKAEGDEATDEVGV